MNALRYSEIDAEKTADLEGFKGHPLSGRADIRLDLVQKAANDPKWTSIQIFKFAIDRYIGVHLDQEKLERSI